MNRAEKSATNVTLGKIVGGLVACGLSLTLVSCVVRPEQRLSTQYVEMWGEQVARPTSQFIYYESMGGVVVEPERPSYGGDYGGFRGPYPGFSFGINTGGNHSGFHGHYDHGRN